MRSIPASVQELDPALALRSGRFDPTALLVLWALRKSVVPLLLGGIVYVDLVTDFDGEGLVVESASEWFAELLSPFAVIAVAIGIRWLTRVGAFALAYPLTRWTAATDYATEKRDKSRYRLVRDRLYFTRAYRELRWTWAVRQVAIDRLGTTGRRLALVDPITRWSTVVLVVLLILVPAFT